MVQVKDFHSTSITISVGILLKFILDSSKERIKVMGKNKKNFESLKDELQRKGKELKNDEEMSCYVDSNRNIAVLLDSTALENERRNTRQCKETVPSVSSTLYFKQAKYFMKGKKYEKALSYLKVAIEVSDIDDMSTEDGIGKESY